MGKLSLYPTLVPRLNKSPPPLILQFKSLIHLTVSKYTFVLDNKAEIIILKVLRLNCDSSSFRFSRLNLIASSSYDCSFPGEPQNWSSHSLSPSSWSQMCLTLTQNRRHNVYELVTGTERRYLCTVEEDGYDPYMTESTQSKEFWRDSFTHFLSQINPGTSSLE